tara:strand:+ start:666 stop:809 length:144 start_codon:yes stop_codon:yes gene_type:complete
MNYKLFLIWFILIVLWNFGFPSADPIFDVIIAVLLSFIMKFLEDFIK